MHARIALLLEDAASLIEGEHVRPAGLAAKLARRFALIGVTGTVRMALSGLDAAMWDALARAAALPLASMLGSSPRPIRAYNSCGLGLMAPDALADEATRLAGRGFKAVKLRLGYPTLKEDLSALKAVRERLGTVIDIMVDYNQALSLEEAMLRADALASEGIAWIEEPIRHDDLAGNARIAAASKIPLQLGENFNGVEAMSAMVQAQACHFVMPDLARIGGVTGWMRCRGPCFGTRDPDVVSPLSRGERALACGHADSRLAGVCRLGGCDPARTPPDRQRHGYRTGTPGRGSRMGSRRSRTLPDELIPVHRKNEVTAARISIDKISSILST